jgi:TRAP-type C4-dicarboxylate transport system permease small subunit
MKGFLRTIERIDWALAAVGGGLCLMAILLLTVATVYGRYVLETDLIPGGYNMIEGAFFPLMVFWGLPLAHREGAFPRLEVLEGFPPGPVRHAIAAFVLLIEALIYAVVAYYAARFAWMAWDTGRSLQIGTGFWPAWPVAIMAPLSFALMLVEIVRLMIVDARRMLGIAA